MDPEAVMECDPSEEGGAPAVLVDPRGDVGGSQAGCGRAHQQVGPVAGCGPVAGAGGGVRGANVVAGGPSFVRAKAEQNGGFEASVSAVVPQSLAGRMGVVMGYPVEPGKPFGGCGCGQVQ